MIKLECAVGDALFVADMGFRKFETSKKWLDTTHFHVDHEIHIILEGDALIEIDGKDTSVNAGDICLLAPHSSHYPKGYSDNLEKTNFYFSLTRIYSGAKKEKSFSEYLYYSNIFKSVKDFFLVNDIELIAIIKGLLAEDFSKENEHIFSALMSLFFIRLAKRIKEQLSSDKFSPLLPFSESEILFRQRRIVEEFFQKRYNEEVSIDDLAKELCLSVSHTHRVVKKVFNEGFKKTLMKQRLEHACMLIKQKNLTLTEIAFLCGYTSYNGFLSAFKSHLGKSPKEYERSVR